MIRLFTMTCRLADTCGGGSSCWALVGPDPTNRRTEDVLYYYLYGTTAEKCIAIICYRLYHFLYIFNFNGYRPFKPLLVRIAKLVLPDRRCPRSYIAMHIVFGHCSLEGRNEHTRTIYKTFITVSCPRIHASVYAGLSGRYLFSCPVCCPHTDR